MDIKLIDTHCHLEMNAFDSDREDVMQRARDAGIEAMITIGSDLKGNVGGLELSGRYDFIYSSVGFHPHDAKDFNEKIFDKIKEWGLKFGTRNSETGMDKEDSQLPTAHHSLLAPRVVAIGEIGLDYHYDNSPREVQREVFIRQLNYAMEINLPVIIHSREAKQDTLDILKDAGVHRGVLHCFSGDIEMAEKAMAMGFCISIAGPVTFKNAKRLQEVVRVVPDDYLLIETDAPYLTPEPFRGKRNEPAYIVHTAGAIAGVRGISFEDVARITTLNAKRLFGIGSLPGRGEIAYKIRDALYLNITHRCTNKCSFCIRFQSDYVKGHNLRLSDEPSEEDLKIAIGDPSRFGEVVFCGYGEPLLRLDLVKNVGSWIKQHKGKVRINTNGHGNLIHRRNVLPELHGIVDSVSISLDAHDEEAYNRLCKPVYNNAYREVIDFIREAKRYIPEVGVTVVALEGIDIEKCRNIARDLGVGFRVRKLDVVG